MRFFVQTPPQYTAKCPQYRIIKNGLGEYYVELSFKEGEWNRHFGEKFDSLEKARRRINESQEANRKWREKLELARQEEVVDGPHDY